ncbi:hypothetical protein NE619_07020 [Anaerovorax odorimutans]|uniref:Uncharacterized protein n=1 Tax=Anaerovorax odorimutans TaxID=109327 RepID=A0ABT1RMQ7_9FIRM|nr:hypothetical protein [Anaerovorax odorimutans]
MDSHRSSNPMRCSSRNQEEKVDIEFNHVHQKGLLRQSFFFFIAPKLIEINGFANQQKVF